jgi:hypothetical protein
MVVKRPDHCCKGIAKSGKPCRAAATAGGLCFFHANPNKAAELGRLGGRSKNQIVTEGLDPLPALDNAIAVRDTLARLITDVHAGKVALNTAAELARLLNLQLRALESIAKFEERRKASEGSMSISERFRRAQEGRKRVEAARAEQLVERASALARISSSSHQPAANGQDRER